MRILHTVESYTPEVNGMQEVVKQLSESLVQMGHEVVVATSVHPKRQEYLVNGVQIREFDIRGNMINGFEGDIQSYISFLLESDFDIVTNFAAQQWATDLMLPILPLVRGKKVFVPTGFSALYNPQYAKYFAEMESWLHTYDANVFLADNYRDIDLAKKVNAPNILKIPNGASHDEFANTNQSADIRAKYNIDSDAFLIFTVGSHTGMKGHKDAIKIFEEAKIENAVLVINGNQPVGGCVHSCEEMTQSFNRDAAQIAARKKILNISPPRADTVELFKSADLFLFPSNIECSPIVLFEANAAKTPFLVTDVGNSQEIIEWTHGGMLLPTTKNAEGYSFAQISESARLLEKMFVNPALRAELAQQGYEAWLDKFTWEKIAGRYQDLYTQLVNNKESEVEKFDLTIITSNSEHYQAGFLLEVKTKNPEIKNLVIQEATSDAIYDLNQAKTEMIYLWPSKTNSVLDLSILLRRSRGVKSPSILLTSYIDKSLNESKLDLGSLEFIVDKTELIELLKANAVNTNLAGSLVYRNENNLTDEIFVSDWSTILSLAKAGYQVTTVTTFSRNQVHNNLNNNSLLRIYTKWIDHMQSNEVGKWSNLICWNLQMKGVQAEDIKFWSSIDTNISQRLFKKVFGSFKLYLIAYLSAKALKTFVTATTDLIKVVRQSYKIIRN